MASFQRKSLIATAAIFCCRFTGLLREVVYTMLFGATSALDAFLTAFRVPNMLRDMFAEGALSQSFTSVMSKVDEREGHAAAWSLAHHVASQLMSLMLCIVAGGVLLAGVMMQWLYPQRVAIELSLPPVAAAPAERVEAVYGGMRENADGVPIAVFRASQPLSGVEPGACVRRESLDKLRPGQSIALSRLPCGSDSLRVDDRSYLDLAASLCRIMWPYILLASLSALSMGALNVFGIFGLPNLASAAFNLTTIASGLLIGWYIDPSFGSRALYGFAVGVVLGGVAQVLVQVPKLRKFGYRPRFALGLVWRGGRLGIADAQVRRVWWLMFPGAIAAGITQLNVFINSMFALYLPGGAVTALNCAFHLWQLPVALFGVAIGMVTLPSISRMTLNEGKGEIAKQLAIALRFMAFFAIPSAVLLGVWGEQIISVFYQRGRFDAQASILAGQVLASYSLGLFSYAGMKVLQPIFMALEKPWAPAGIALAAAALSVGLNWTFVHLLGLDAPWLAFTTACVTSFNFLFFYIYLRRLLGSMAERTLLPGLLRILLAGAALFAFCYLIRSHFLSEFTHWSFLVRLGVMVAAGACAGLLYLLAAFIFRVPELQTLSSRLRRSRPKA